MLPLFILEVGVSNWRQKLNCFVRYTDISALQSMLHVRNGNASDRKWAVCKHGKN